MRTFAIVHTEQTPFLPGQHNHFRRNFKILSNGLIALTGQQFVNKGAK